MQLPWKDGRLLCQDNPTLKALATEKYEKQETNLFGPGFLEKASKRLEAEKTMNKVSGQSNKNGPLHKRARYENNKSDLWSFLARGASAMYGRKMAPSVWW